MQSLNIGGNCEYMLYKQLYEYNKLDSIICSHRWAAPHLLPATPAQQLLACYSSAPRYCICGCLARCATCSPVSAAPTPLTIPLKLYISSCLRLVRRQ